MDEKDVANKFAAECRKRLNEDEEWQSSKYVIGPVGTGTDTGVYLASIDAHLHADNPSPSDAAAPSYHVHIHIMPIAGDDNAFNIEIVEPPALRSTMRVSYVDGNVAVAAQQRYQQAVSQVVSYLKDAVAGRALPPA